MASWRIASDGWRGAGRVLHLITLTSGSASGSRPQLEFLAGSTLQSVKLTTFCGNRFGSTCSGTAAHDGPCIDVDRPRRSRRADRRRVSVRHGRQLDDWGDLVGVTGPRGARAPPDRVLAIRASRLLGHTRPTAPRFSGALSFLTFFFLRGPYGANFRQPQRGCCLPQALFSYEARDSLGSAEHVTVPLQRTLPAQRSINGHQWTPRFQPGNATAQRPEGQVRRFSVRASAAR